MNRDVTKGPGDLWHEEEDNTMDEFEQWLEDLDNDPSTKLDYLEQFITYKRSATGTVLSSMESPYGTIATVACELDSAFEQWLAEKYQAEVLPMLRNY